MKKIDLRSDTVTMPTQSMLKAMAAAEAGDDVYGEDPTVNRLQTMAAERMGKEAGLYLPSGTMGNLTAVLVHCNRGDEVIMGNRAHTFLFEGGGVSALGGVAMYLLPNEDDGTLKMQDLQSAVRPDNPHHPRSRLVVLENTQNRCGGAPLSVEYTNAVGEFAHSNGLLFHLDGARIFNAAVAMGTTARELAAPADSITFCLSKGLCAPVGSVLCGSKEFIHDAIRIRKQLGGGMRQVGYIAAAGIVALEEMTERLVEDHQRLQALSDGLLKLPGLYKYLNPPISTNMLFIALDDSIPVDGAAFIEKMAQQNIMIGSAGPRHFRMVTHYWISDEDVTRTIKAFNSILSSL
ncbi:MAG: low-specificity L-threonine aldolase [Chloroflexi bacterium]|nr:low-specificity L-threonine aldolase [Chloroflexota bacterium]